MSVTEKRTEFYVGLFVFVGLAIMAVLVLQFGRFEDRLKEKYPLHVTFTDATGIKKGVDIRLGGVKIGEVAGSPRPTADFNGVVVDLDIFDGFKIPRNARIGIRSSGLMGDRYIGVQIPDAPSGEFMEPDEVIAGDPGGDLEAITRTAEEISEQAKVLMGELTAVVKDMRAGVDSLNNSLAKVDDEVLDEENLENIKVAIKKMRDTSDTLNAASNKIEPILDEAKEAVAGASDTFETAQEMVAKLEPVIDEFRETAEGAGTTVALINEGDGLLSALLNDPELRADFEALVANLRTHGVIFYKDKTEEGASPKPSVDPPAPARKRPFGKR